MTTVITMRLLTVFFTGCVLVVVAEGISPQRIRHERSVNDGTTATTEDSTVAVTPRPGCKVGNNNYQDGDKVPSGDDCIICVCRAPYLRCVATACNYPQCPGGATPIVIANDGICCPYCPGQKPNTTTTAA